MDDIRDDSQPVGGDVGLGSREPARCVDGALENNVKGADGNIVVHLGRVGGEDVDEVIGTFFLTTLSV